MIRRRRECARCRRRYTTFERVEDLGFYVVKRNGIRESYDPEKVRAGIQKAIGNRPVGEEAVARVVERVGDRLRRKGPEVTSRQIGVEVLSQLSKLDQVAYLRFASVYKDFQEITDFEREVGAMLEKKEPAKRKR